MKLLQFNCSLQEVNLIISVIILVVKMSCFYLTSLLLFWFPMVMHSFLK